MQMIKNAIGNETGFEGFTINVKKSIFIVRETSTGILIVEVMKVFRARPRSLISSSRSKSTIEYIKDAVERINEELSK